MLLSGWIHADVIGSVLFGFPVLHLVFERESAVASLTIVTDPQEEAQTFAETLLRLDDVFHFQHVGGNQRIRQRGTPAAQRPEAWVESEGDADCVGTESEARWTSASYAVEPAALLRPVLCSQ